MADRSHLEILNNGVEVWNNWRQENPDIVPDLQDADLSGCDFSRVNLRNALMNGISGSSLVFYEADLSGAQMRNASCPGINLSKAKLGASNFSGADFSDAYLVDAKASFATARKAKLTKANLFGANFNGCDMAGAELREAIFYQADLTKSNLSNTNLTKANLKEVNLSACLLNNATLSHSDVERSILSDSSLVKADLYRVNFRQSDLRRSDMSEAIMYEANLEKANLEGAKMISTNLQGANLQHAVFSGTDLTESNMSETLIAGTAWRNVTLHNTIQQNLQVINRDGLDIKADSIELALRIYIHLQESGSNALSGAAKKIIAIIHDGVGTEVDLAEALKKIIIVKGYSPLLVDLKSVPGKAEIEGIVRLSNGCHFLFLCMTDKPNVQSVLNQSAKELRASLVLPFIRPEHEPALQLESLVDYSWVLPLKQVANPRQLIGVIEENVVRPYANLATAASDNDSEEQEKPPAALLPADSVENTEDSSDKVNNEDIRLGVDQILQENVRDISATTDSEISESSESEMATSYTKPRRSRRRLDAGADERNESIVQRKRGMRPDSGSDDGESVTDLADSLLLESLEREKTSTSEEEDSIVIQDDSEDSQMEETATEADAKPEESQESATIEDLTRTMVMDPVIQPHRTIWAYVIGGAAVLGLLIAAWFFTHTNTQLQVPAGTQSYVYLDDELLLPDGTRDGFEYYELSNMLIGSYDLQIYSTQLRDIRLQSFVRFKRHSQDIALSRGSVTSKIVFQPDTLYSIRNLTEGKTPVISADGQLIAFYRNQMLKNHRSSDRLSLFTYSIADSVEREVRLSNRRFSNYEWDRAFFVDNDVVMMSAYDGRQTGLYNIELNSGQVTRVSFNPGSDWIAFVPFSATGSFLAGNSLYNSRGDKLRSIADVKPFLDKLYPVSGGGAIYYQEKPAGNGGQVAKLQARYLNKESLLSETLFEVFRGFNPPFVSASRDADKQVISEYSGATAQFSTSIKLNTDQGMVKLTNPLADGARSYPNGDTHHRTEAVMDGEGRRIVYDHGGIIYLLQFGSTATFRDFIEADMDLRRGK